MCDIELSRLIKQKRFSKSAGWVIVLLTILSVISMCILLRLPLRIDRLKKKVLIILIVIRRRTEAIENSTLLNPPAQTNLQIYLPKSSPLPFYEVVLDLGGLCIL